MISRLLLPLLGLGVVGTIVSVTGISIFNFKILSNIHLPKKIRAQTWCDGTISDPNIGTNYRPIGDKQIKNKLIRWNLDLSSEDTELLKQNKTVGKNVTVIDWSEKLTEGPIEGVTIKNLNCGEEINKTLNLSQVPPFEIQITLQNCNWEKTEQNLKCPLKIMSGNFEWNAITMDY